MLGIGGEDREDRTGLLRALMLIPTDPTMVPVTVIYPTSPRMTLRLAPLTQEEEEDWHLLVHMRI